MSADGGALASRRPKRFIPFSAGARDCVGRSLATINYKMLLALLLGSFRFRLATEVSIWSCATLFQLLGLRLVLI